MRMETVMRGIGLMINMKGRASLKWLMGLYMRVNGRTARRMGWERCCKLMEVGLKAAIRMISSMDLASNVTPITLSSLENGNSA